MFRGEIDRMYTFLFGFLRKFQDSLKLEMHRSLTPYQYWHENTEVIPVNDRELKSFITIDHCIKTVQWSGRQIHVHGRCLFYFSRD